MVSYWLITEPARGTSIRVTVRNGDADASLLAYCHQHYPEVVLEWREQAGRSLAEVFYDIVGDHAELIEETLAVEGGPCFRELLRAIALTVCFPAYHEALNHPEFHKGFAIERDVAKSMFREAVLEQEAKFGRI